MKKLIGMKRNFSSENKKLNRNELKSVHGGLLRSAIKCNLVNAEGCTDTDYYTGENGTGEYITRGWLCVG